MQLPNAYKPSSGVVVGPATVEQLFVPAFLAATSRLSCGLSKSVFWRATLALSVRAARRWSVVVRCNDAAVERMTFRQLAATEFGGLTRISCESAVRSIAARRGVAARIARRLVPR